MGETIIVVYSVDPVMAVELWQAIGDHRLHVGGGFNVNLLHLPFKTLRVAIEARGSREEVFRWFLFRAPSIATRKGQEGVFVG